MAITATENVKDRDLLAQVAGGIAAGIAGQNFVVLGNKPDEDLIADYALSIARKIIARIDAAAAEPAA